MIFVAVLIVEFIYILLVQQMNQLIKTLHSQ